MTKPAWQNRIVGYSDDSIDELLANPANWRVHPKHQQDALRGVLKEVGIVQNVIVNDRTGHLVDGHLRVQLAYQDNQPTVPVTHIDVSEDEEREILATLDPIAALATTDAEKLDELLREVQSGEAGVQAMLAELAEQNGVIPGAPVELPLTDSRYSEQYGVIVICADESEQERVYTELSARGLECRVVVT